MKHSTHKLVLSLTASILAACGAQAYDVPLTFLGTNMPPVTFHGFASQGFLYSDDYNYLGDTTRGSFLFTEGGLNASFNPFPRTRITAQAFTYDVGQEVGKYDFILDYALAEYTFSDGFGVRAGRIRRPEGIYNDIVDVDLARTFVLLPQGIYDTRWRDFYVSMDGGSFFGTIPLSKAGSLDYEVYGGLVRPQPDGGLAQLYRNILPPFIQFDSFEANPQVGEQLWWHTPLNGLRFGVAGGYNFNYTINTTILTPVGGIPNEMRYDVPFAHFSAEYVWNRWTFQGEYFTYWLLPETGDTMHVDSWYASAAYRFNKWLEAGTYYTEYYGDTSSRGDPTQYQKDLALGLRFDPTPWWIFKVEGHYIHGTGLLNDNTSNPNQDDRGWFMLALKTTFSF